MLSLGHYPVGQRSRQDEPGSCPSSLNEADSAADLRCSSDRKKTGPLSTAHTETCSIYTSNRNQMRPREALEAAMYTIPDHFGP